MAEALKCPSCAAPLQWPAGNTTSMRCPYCSTTVLLSSLQSAAVDPAGSGVGAAIDLGQLRDLIRSGKKIEAIKIFRELNGVDLASAKAAIDRLSFSTGAQPPADIARTINSSVRFARGLTVGILLFTGLIITIVMISVHVQVARTTTLTPLPAMPRLPGIPSIAETPPAPPAFADEVMHFGSEGIGAGQFKDSRSIAVDAHGKIFVGEYSDGRIQVFDPNGQFISEWIIGKNKSLMNLTVDRNGVLYAVIPFDIVRYDTTTGMPLGKAENMLDGEALNYMDAFAGIDGNIYAVTSNSQIVVLDHEGKVKSVIDAAQKVGEDVNFDRIAVLGTGEMFCLDRNRGVFKFAPDGRYINRIEAQMDNPQGKLFAPEYLAVDGQGRLYVSDSSHAIEVYDSNLQFIDSMGDNDVCFGVAVDDQNNIFGCFRNDHQIRKFAINKR